MLLLGLLSGGCSHALEGVGAGSTSNGDAGRCVSQAAGIGVDLQAYPSDCFLVLSSTGSDSAAASGQFLDQVQRQFYDSFTRAGFALQPLPGKLICVCLRSYAELDSYGRQADGTDVSWMDGYYSYRTNRIAIVQGCGASQARPTAAASAGRAGVYGAVSSGLAAGEGMDLRTVTHELAHQLAFNSGLQRRGVTYPFWLTEGLATNFEADYSRAYGLGPKDCCYRGRLLEAKAAGRWIPLPQFAAMADVHGGSDQATRDAYAQAWGLFRYLLLRKPQQLTRYMSSLSATGLWDHGPQSLDRRFVGAFGPIGPLEADYQRFIDQLRRGETR